MNIIEFQVISNKLILIECKLSDLKPNDVVKIEHFFYNNNSFIKYWNSDYLIFLYGNDNCYHFTNGEKFWNINKKRKTPHKLLGKYITEDEFKLLKLNNLLDEWNSKM